MELAALISVGLMVVLTLIFVGMLAKYMYQEFGGGLPSPYAPTPPATTDITGPVLPADLLVPNNLGVVVFNPEVPRPRQPGTTGGLDILPDETPRPPSGQGGTQDISDIPQSNVGCADQFSQCGKWADNGECTINPEFMLENCPFSCNRCGINREQKNRIISHYMSKPPVKCLNRGVPYPAYYKLLAAAYDVYV